VVLKSVERILGETGLTGFQKNVVAISGFAWTFVAEGLVVMVLGFPFQAKS
jgi:hypothetical protein